MSTEFTYGPFKNIVGTWGGDKGLDLSPEPDGTEENLYYETIEYSEVGEVVNAEKQRLQVLHYVQKVNRIKGNKDIHHETGYLMWEKETNQISLSLIIPRGLAMTIAGTIVEESDEKVIVEFSTSEEGLDMIQSPFLKGNALSKSFKRTYTISKGELSYSQVTELEIYDREFSHTEENTLQQK
jgi:hypothetical protein